MSSRFSNLSKQQRQFFFFGLPFLVTMVGSTFMLGQLTQTKYDLHDKKVMAQVSKEEELKLDANRKKLNLQEEYFKLAENERDWDMVRVPRPKGVEEPVFRQS
ncbi:cytochrome c oxidase assembly protein COX16-domain-containing protein [Chytriomyces sp. MP71]|nr:cytochrome c oxidase assembly protein COX16-domain-containing protein [Chytriomyces sp. MP71]